MKKAPIPSNESARVGALYNLRVLDTTAEEEFDRITKLAAKTCDTKISLVSLVDSERQWFKSKFGLDANETPRDISYCGHAIMQDELFIIEDATKDERFSDNPLCIGAPNVVFYAGVPLKTSTGQRIGTLCVIDDTPKSLTSGQKETLVGLGKLVIKLLELRLVEKQFKEISEAAKIAHWSFDVTTQEIEWSDKMYELFNFDIINGPPNFEQYKALIHSDDFHELEAAIFSSIKNKVSYTVNHRVFDKSGNEKWLEGFGEPVLDSNNNVVALNGVCQDINEKMLINLELQEYQKELKESNTYLNFALEGAGLGIWDWYLEDNSVNFDKNWARILGYDISEVKLELASWEDKVHPDDIGKCFEDIQAYMDGKTEYYENTHRIKHKNGHWIWTLGRGRFSDWDENGKPIRFTGTILDVSIAKEQEANLLSAYREQEILNKLLKIGKEHEADLHAKLDKALRLIFGVPWLNVFQKGGLFLADDEKLNLEVSIDLGETIESMCKTVDCGRCLCGRAMQTKEVIHASCVDERHENTFEGISPHGHYNVPILGRENKVLGVTVYYLPHGHKKNDDEITFLKACSDVLSQIIISHHYEMDLIEQRDLARTSEKSKSNFLANMSHEIRTPMNGIIGLLELFTTEGLDDSQKELVKTLKNSSDHLLNILNDILDFSKIDSGNLTLEKVPFNVKDLLSDIVKLNSRVAQGKGIDLNLKFNSDNVDTVIGDPVRFRQVLDNFVSNAIKFTDDGFVSLEYNVVKKTKKEVTFKIDIIDSGIGLSEQEGEKLFTSFTQADSSITRKYGGTGLGLAISKKLAQAMGGEIEFKSEKGKGSTFSFIIKLKTSDKTIGEVRAEDLLHLTKELNVLVVEDNLVNQKILLMMLKKLDIEADVANNGVECIDLIKKTKSNYDVIFMDMQMPEMDGLNCTKKIRKNNLGGNPFIIAQTANAYLEDKDLCFEAGMNEFIAKPIKKQDLIRVLNEYISNLDKVS